MLKLGEEQKQMFYSDRYSYDYRLTFQDISLVITNNTLHSEAVTVKEAICDDADFTLGGCIASSMEYEVSEIIANQISGLEFTAELAVRNEDGSIVLQIPMGIFRVDSASRINDKDYKRVTAFDRIYDASVDVSEWYKGYFANGAKHTVKETRESLLTYLGIPFVVQILLNDEVMLQKTTEPGRGTLPGTDVLKSLCTINGAFGRMNRQGKFEVIYSGYATLFPEETLYPAEDLYPEDTFAYLGISSGEDDVPEYRSTNYEEYITQKITCLYIQTDRELAQIGSDISNPYIISNNFLLHGKTATELEGIGQNIFSRIKDTVYRPNTTELTGLPYMEAGDAFALVKRTDTIESFIFSRTLSGIQALKDTYEAKGNEIRANELSISDKISQLEEKDVALEEDLEETNEKLSDFEEKTTVRFEQTEDSIEAEVSRATAAEGNLSSRITITADEIAAEVSRATAAEGNLSSRITITADEIAAEVSRATTAEGNLSSRITINAEGISTKVTKGTVVSEINQTSDRIILSANRLVVDSTNFTLDANGNATFSGTLSGATGTFGSLRSTGGSLSGLYGVDSQFLTISENGFINNLTATTISSNSNMSVSGNITASGGITAYGLTANYLNINSNAYLASISSPTIDAIYVQINNIASASDKRLKYNIKDIQEDFVCSIIDGAMPKEYYMKEKSDDKKHFGMVAQDVKEQLKKMGISDGDLSVVNVLKDDGVIVPKGEKYYGISYIEYIPILIKYCQMLKRDLQKEIKERKSQKR
ncbi:hypothetical protein D7V86_24840 [bacterium D16-51]|nr:hypothetical protein D7V96_23470 [bacterium D16-59]RKI53607.1 hypothetical protein D7V86_24840 [bacterium D16-51]